MAATSADRASDFTVEVLAGSPNVYSISGEVDLTNAPDLERQVLSSLGSERFALDLTPLRFIDSAGLRMLTRLGERFDFALIVPDESLVRRTIEIVNLDDLVPIFESVADPGFLQWSVSGSAPAPAHD